MRRSLRPSPALPSPPSWTTPPQLPTPIGMARQRRRTIRFDVCLRRSILDLSEFRCGNRCLWCFAPARSTSQSTMATGSSAIRFERSGNLSSFPIATIGRSWR
ncbi:hypothetical protein BT93_C1168 [Corymbia citriodora subsp. variegata]|nr:hypothetical protein BT93_C1168 [Corymbia citriodora subsp. variegata]